jgi:hypothetical protein
MARILRHLVLIRNPDHWRVGADGRYSLVDAG